MKPTLFALFLLLANIAFPQTAFVGDWSGILETGSQKLELMFHVRPDGSDSYSTTLDVPLQMVKHLPCSKTTITADSIFIEIKNIGALYKGKITEKTKLNGVWQQSGFSFQLNFDKTMIAVKPQTPKPPFNYETIDTVYKGIDTKLEYGATLTYPKNKKNIPVIILITGSGKQDRDETIFDHKPFAVIADYLTNNGYAVLRVDDRGAGKSTGNFVESSSLDFVNDVLEHIRYIKTLNFIDTSKIGLLGHSEGGLIAPIVATMSPSVSFIILMAAPGIDITDLMSLQNEKVMRTLNKDTAAIAAYSVLHSKLMKAIANSADKEGAKQSVRTIVETWMKETNPEYVKSTTGISDEKNEDVFIETWVNQLYTKWWRHFLNFKPGNILKNVKCPVLALNGSKDIQVVAEPNLMGIEKSLKAGGNHTFTIKSFDGLNHLFQRCNKCDISEYATLDTTIEPIVLKTIADWLNQNVYR